MKAPKEVLTNCGVSTQRDWRRLKLKQLQAAIQAMEKVQRGAAYTPKAEGVYIGLMMTQLRQLFNVWSVKKWGE